MAGQQWAGVEALLDERETQLPSTAGAQGYNKPDSTEDGERRPVIHWSLLKHEQAGAAWRPCALSSQLPNLLKESSFP